MSLEDALAANTAAIEKHTEALERFMASAKATHGGAAKAEPETKAEKKAEAKAPAKGKGKSKKEPWESDDTFRAACGDYLKWGETKEDRARIRETVQPILDHFGVTRFTEIAEEQRKECYEYIVTLTEAVKEGGIEAAEAVDLGLGNEGAGNDDLV